jgi:hypothetical protein
LIVTMVTADTCVGTAEPCGWGKRPGGRTPNVIVYIFDEIVKIRFQLWRFSSEGLAVAVSAVPRAPDCGLPDIALEVLMRGQLADRSATASEGC